MFKQKCTKQCDQIILRLFVGYLTRGQAWHIINRLIDLCRTEPITRYDIKTFLTNIQLEYHRQQPIYPKLLDYMKILVESYSSSLSDIHSFEQDLQNLLRSFHNNIKRMPDEIRKHLNDMILFCRKLNNDHILIGQLFSDTTNYKYYNQMKEILTTKNFINRKQFLTAIVQMCKYFLKISNLNSYKLLSEYQLDVIFENSQIKYSKQCHSIEEILKNMADLGHLQVKF